MNIQSLLATKRIHLFTIQPDESVEHAIALLTQHNIGALLVMDSQNQLKGILSERDIIHGLAQDRNILNMSVAEVMTRNVIVGIPQDDIESVAHTMTEKRFRHLPVMENGIIIGIVTIGDIVKYQRDQYQGEIHTLQTQISESGDQE